MEGRQLFLLIILWISSTDSLELGKYSEYSCDGDIVLTCPQPDPSDPDLKADHIRIDNATYGQYDSCPIDACCEPSEADCEEFVSVVYPPDWESIITKCNMTQGSCTIKAQPGSTLPNCPFPNYSNFHVVYYTCVLTDGSIPTTTTTTPAPTTPETTTMTTRPPATRPPTTDPPPPPGEGANVGAIIGGVLGGLCLVAIVVLIVLICKRRQEAKKAMKNRQNRPVVIRNGHSVPRSETPIYDNPAFENRIYDEEMIISADKRPRALSKTSSQVYENVNVNVKDLPDGAASNGVAAANSPGKKTDEGDSVSHHSQSTVTHYENVDVKVNPNPYIQVDNKPENGSVASAKFEKKVPNTSQTKDKAPVAKKAAPVNPNLGKAQSAMDVSTTAKIDKAGPHKQSAPNLGTLSIADDNDRKNSEFGSTKPKSVSAQDLKRRSVAESVSSTMKEDIKEEKEEDIKEEEEGAEKGPGKELF